MWQYGGSGVGGEGTWIWLPVMVEAKEENPGVELRVVYPSRVGKRGCHDFPICWL